MTETAQPTVFGEAFSVTGDVTGDDDLIIFGRVEGSIRISGRVVVEASALVKAEISAREAIISGIVLGNVAATESVRVTNTGRLVGNVAGVSVGIEPGAQVRGEVHAGDEVPEAMLNSSKHASKSTPSRVVSLPARRPALHTVGSTHVPVYATAAARPSRVGFHAADAQRPTVVPSTAPHTATHAVEQDDESDAKKAKKKVVGRKRD